MSEAPKKLSLKELRELKGKKGTGSESFVPNANPEPENPSQPQASFQPQIPDLGLGPLDADTQLTPQLYNDIAHRAQQNPQFVQLLIAYYPHIYQQFIEQMNMLKQQHQQQQQEQMYYQQQQHQQHHGHQGGYYQQHQPHYEDEQYEEEEEVEEQPQQAQRGLGDKQDLNKQAKQQKGAQKQGGNQNQGIQNQKGGNQKGAQNQKGGQAGQNKGAQQPTTKKEVVPVQPKRNIEEVVDVQKTIEKEKNADKLADFSKEPMNIIFIGHVDSGKSTICGTILMLSGKVDKEELRRNEIEAKEKNRTQWTQAYIMDIDDDEREKGVTVEIGKAMFELKNKRFTIIDAPGHKNYVPNMIAGASQADLACLVISAKSGEFEAGMSGQTREHAILASYLGCSQLIVVINKMDDNGWDIKRFNFIKDTMSPFLKEICEYDLETQVRWVPVAALAKVNMAERVSEAVCPWYKGESLFDTLDNIPKNKRVYRDCLRIPVADKYNDKDLIIYGKIESGSLKEGMKLMLMPNKKEFSCSKICDNEDRSLTLATTGDNIKFYAKGLVDEDVRRGNVVCGLQYVCHICYEFEAELTVIDPPPNKVISNGFPAVLHLHAIQEEVEIVSVKTNKNTKKSGGLLCLKQGDTGKVVIKVILSIILDNQRQASLHREVHRVP